MLQVFKKSSYSNILRFKFVINDCDRYSIKATNQNHNFIDHERDKTIAQGGYLDTCRDYRLPSLNFGKMPKCSGIYLGNIQKSIANR